MNLPNNLPVGAGKEPKIDQMMEQDLQQRTEDRNYDRPPELLPIDLIKTTWNYDSINRIGTFGIFGTHRGYTVHVHHWTIEDEDPVRLLTLSACNLHEEWVEFSCYEELDPKKSVVKWKPKMKDGEIVRRREEFSGNIIIMAATGLPICKLNKEGIVKEFGNKDALTEVEKNSVDNVYSMDKWVDWK